MTRIRLSGERDSAHLRHGRQVHEVLPEVDLQGRDHLDARKATAQSFQTRQLLQLQRTAGNAAACHYIVQRDFEDQGSAGDTQKSSPIEIHPARASAVPLGVNQFGEIDVGMTSNVVPQLFVDNGKAGVGLVNWAGGNGGEGIEHSGSITLVAPQYDSAAPSAAGKPAEAWITSGTGKTKVVRSFRGVQKGANAAYYFTARASSRASSHERMHVKSSKQIHDANIKPLDTRVAKYKGKGKAIKTGTSAAGALAALQAIVNWNAQVSAFSTADVAANTVMGTIDNQDMASPTFVCDYGAKTIKGTNYAHYIDTPPGPKA